MRTWMKDYDDAGAGHWWLANKTCRGCGMHIHWPGARDKCTLAYKAPDGAKEPLGLSRAAIRVTEQAIERATNGN